eukprot:Phypoly_transcript_08886.p1 GENE.Phypoly_transcript_08886~~Phypoly_transcript_08886.p1  ORF type:complete len:440 (-),score=62.82 Phypoly_transcript_08886:51-1370(-)
MLRLVLCTLLALVALSYGTPQFSVLDISNFGFNNLEGLKFSLKTVHGAEWCIEVGDKLLTFSEYPSTLTIRRTVEPIFIVSKVHISYLEGLEDKILLHNLGFAIIQAPREAILETLQRNQFRGADRIENFDFTNRVLATQLANTRQDQGTIPESNAGSSVQAVSIQTLVDSVSESRWFSGVTALAQYNRYTRGTGIASAEKWIIDQLSGLKNLTITTQPFTSGATSGVNIIATLKGTTQPNRIVIIGGHYDSTSQSPNTAAPGAEDDASGASAVLEMARIFNQYGSPATAMFMFYSGEEQGLLGSAANAQSFVNQGNASKVALMHNMDMIAYQRSPSGPNQVLLETTSKWASTLFPYYRTSATRYTTLGVFESTTAWGSDHESYLNRGMPGLLTIDKDWDTYPSYHRTTDTPDKLTPALGYQIIRLGVGAIAQALGFSH